MPRRRYPLRIVKTPRPEPVRAVPLYVCAGARDEAIAHAVFPYGSNLSQMRPCPNRDRCLWYSGHDLGGRDLITDFPEMAVIEPAFRPYPFFCPHFSAQSAVAPKRNARRR